MHYVILGNDLTAWAIAIGIGLTIYFVLSAAKRFTVGRLALFAATTVTYLDDLAVKILSKTHPWFILFIGMYAGTQWLVLNEARAALLSHLAITALLLQMARWGDIGVMGWLDHYRSHRAGHDPASATSTAALGFVARAVIWLVVVLMILDNFGVNITTLVASLGIGGIAVALALQNILGDLFSSLSIVLDKPFEVGDFINVDDISGTVEHVGMKTTRVRGLGGEQVIFSNSDLLKSRIRNFKRMQTRRIVFAVGVTYNTSKEHLNAIPVMLRAIVEAQPDIKFDRAHFKSFGASSLDFETVYIMQTPDYGAYMDAQQAINQAIFERFEQEEIEFAFPTQTLYLSRGARSDATEK